MGIRPFIYTTTHASRDLERTEFLYPLGRHYREEGDRKLYVVPFTLHKDEVTYPSEGRREKAYSLLPVFWGETDTGEKYGGVFPLSGHLKGRFARDEITFFLWPAYSRVRKREEVTRTYFWPFVRVTKGSAEGLSVWPLRGHKEKEGVYSRGFFLWPLYVYVDEDLDTDTPVRKRYYMPFYASIRSPKTKVNMYVPPFFFHQKSHAPTFEKWEIWPFVTKADGPGIIERKVFPVFRLRREPDSEHRFFLWPLYTYGFNRYVNEEHELHRFLLVNKYRVVKETDTGREIIDSNLWPLFDSHKESDGRARFHIFNLFPLFDEGLERNIYPLFWIYRYNRSPDGEMLSDFLWGLYRRRVSPQGSLTQLAFLLTVEKRDEDDLSVSFLAGLFGYRKTRDGTRLRLLGIDF